MSAATCPPLQYGVPYAETDQMGVVYYGHYLTYFERARTHVLRELGYAYGRLEADGFLLPVIEAHVNYLQPAHYEDVLTLSCRFETVSPVRIRALCEVRRGADLLAYGHTIHVCVAKATQKPARFPAAFVAQVQRGAGDPAPA